MWVPHKKFLFGKLFSDTQLQNFVLKITVQNYFCRTAPWGFEIPFLFWLKGSGIFVNIWYRFWNPLIVILCIFCSIHKYFSLWLDDHASSWVNSPQWRCQSSTSGFFIAAVVDLGFAALMLLGFGVLWHWRLVFNGWTSTGLQCKGGEWQVGFVVATGWIVMGLWFVWVGAGLLSGQCCSVLGIAC